MGGMDWPGRWFASTGHYTGTFPQNSKKIMSKYKPIAPKPSLVSSPNSKSDNPMNPHVRLTSLERSNGSERSNRKRRQPSDFCSGPSPRGRRTKRVPCSPDYLGSERSPIVETVPPSIILDRPKIEHPLDECFGADKLRVVKDSGFMERSSSSFGTRSLCDKKSSVFGEELQLNKVMDSMGKVVIQSQSRSMEVRMRGDPECGLGIAKLLVFPSDIQKHKEEDKNWRNLVTLPLLPETSASKDSDMGSWVPNSTSNSNASYDKQKFSLRIFGKDFSI